MTCSRLLVSGGRSKKETNKDVSERRGRTYLRNELKLNYFAFRCFCGETQKERTHTLEGLMLEGRGGGVISRLDLDPAAFLPRAHFPKQRLEIEPNIYIRNNIFVSK